MYDGLTDEEKTRLRKYPSPEMAVADLLYHVWEMWVKGLRESASVEQDGSWKISSAVTKDQWLDGT